MRSSRPQAFVRRASSDGGGSLSFLAPAPRCVRSKRKARRDSKSSKHAAHRGRRGARDRQPRAARWQHRAVPGLIDVSSPGVPAPPCMVGPDPLSAFHAAETCAAACAQGDHGPAQQRLLQRRTQLRRRLPAVLRRILRSGANPGCAPPSEAVDGDERARSPARPLAREAVSSTCGRPPPAHATYGRAPAAGVAAVRAAVRRLRLGQLPQPRRVLAPLHDIRSWPAGRAAASGSRWPLLC